MYTARFKIRVVDSIIILLLSSTRALYILLAQLYFSTVISLDTRNAQSLNFAGCFLILLCHTMYSRCMPSSPSISIGLVLS